LHADHPENGVLIPCRFTLPRACGGGQEVNRRTRRHRLIEKTLDITTKDGEMETLICHPERNGPSPAVFLLMDAHGVREELKDMARRLGTVGYYVLRPNLYYRAGRDTIYGPDVQEEGSAEHTRMRTVRIKMTIPR
jgi:carboxymethylenebutenolidase